MSYIGAQPTTAAFPFDQFSGNGSTTAFTLSYAPASSTSIVVSISGVVQNPNTYSVSGLTLTFSPAPPTGTNNIGVLYLGLPVQVGVPTPGSTAQFALGSAANPSITFLGDTNTGIYSPGADTLAFTEGGTEVMRIDSSGNVGVGTSSPVATLTVGNAKVLGWPNATGGFNGTTLGTQIFKFSDNNLYIDNLDASTSTIFRRNGNAESARIDGSGNFFFNSGYGSSAIAYGCRAWVNFNGTGTVAIRASGNVTSITDNGTGDYTVNFTTAMPDANYAPVCGTSPAIAVSGTAGSWYFGVKTDASGNPTTKSTSACRVTNAYLNGPGAVADAPELYAAFFR